MALRPDGWPLCPLCGDDEIGALDWPTTWRNLFCYRCAWRGSMHLRVLPVPAGATIEQAWEAARHEVVMLRAPREHELSWATIVVTGNGTLVGVIEDGMTGIRQIAEIVLP
jgi:hypothetical protein